MALKHVLETAGIDLEKDRVQIVPPPPAQPEDGKGNLARSGAHAIEQGLAEGYWGNAMRAEYGVRHGWASVLLDIRRGDGPPAARYFTFPALVTSERLVKEQPDAATSGVRAIMKAQRVLRADPMRAAEAAKRLFPPEETVLIADLMARDAEFFDASVTEEMVAKTSQFARDVGMLTGPVAYEDVVATEFRSLWTE
jgi:ABC-type nitrate/sulfonate/bicarbonate transport system substrate-binding protein